MNALLKTCSLILFFTLNSGFSQNKIETYKDSVKSLLYNNPTKAKYYSHKLLKYAKANDLVIEEAKTYCFLADLSGALTQKDSAFYYFDKAIQKAKDIDNEKFEMVFKINKANYLFNEFDFQEALTLYEECVTLSKKLNDNVAYNYISIKKGSIAYELERYQEALKIYKENLSKKGFDDVSKLDIKLGLVKTYINLNKQDSAYVFIKSGIQESQKSNLKEHEIHFLAQLALIYIDKKDFANAKLTLDKALIIAQKIESNNLITEINIRISKLYSLQKDYNKAITLLKSIIQTEKQSNNIPAENLSEIYYLLAENYKFIENYSESNYYYGQFIEKSKKIGEKRIEAIDHLHKIDITESLERETEQKNQKWILLGVTSFLLLLFVGFFLRRRKEGIQNQIKFEELLLKIQNFENQNAKVSDEPQQNYTLDTTESNESEVFEEEPEPELIQNSIVTINSPSNDELIIENDGTDIDNEEPINSNFIIKDETRAEILDKLIKLEEKKLFLRQDFTLHNVAKRLKTNTAYLSKIVNSELDKNFSSYVNELRINYIIIELKNNAKLRSYSINAIGEEIGYKSPESFTKYFKVATGISPSIYIKKINQMKESENS